MKKPTCSCFTKRMKEMELDFLSVREFTENVDMGSYSFSPNEWGYGISLNLNFCPQCGKEYK